MSRYTTKLQNIQEANQRLEQRMLNEQTAPASSTTTTASDPNSKKWEPIAAKLNANASKIDASLNKTDEIKHDFVTDSDKDLHDIKYGLIQVIQNKVTNNKPITADDLVKIDAIKKDSLYTALTSLSKLTNVYF